MSRTLRFLSVVDLFFAGAVLAPPANADMPHNDMPHNSVSLDGLTRAAPLLDALANGALDDAAISGALAAHPTIKDPDVGRLLDKIVSCALDDGVALAPFPAPAAGTKLAGELGLCGKNSQFGNWHAAPLADPKKKNCLEAVTACVLARVNALGHRIVISVRSRSPAMPIPLQKRVPIETQYRDKRPVASLVPCSPSNPMPNCGYQPQSVGRCIAGKDVVLAAAPGTGIRVCQGLYGCDLGVGLPTYTKVLRANDVGSAKFPCPPNGPTIAGERWGYYSVMTKPASPGASAVTANAGQYPATENTVFTWPEGAFYGNIFRTDTLARGREKYRECRIPGMLAGDENACFSPVWGQGVAQMNDRFCAGEPGCFVNDPMPCFKAANDRCATNALASQAFGDCKPITANSSETTWNLAITTYLNDPCDLSADDACDARKIVVRGQPPDPGGYDKQARAPEKE